MSQVSSQVLVQSRPNRPMSRFIPGRKIVSTNPGDPHSSVRVTISDVVSGKNFRNPTRVLTFTVNLYVNEIKYLELPDVMLIDGRIQIPEKRKRVPGGELRVKVVKPIYTLLKCIWDELQHSTIWEQYPDLPSLVPLRTGRPDEYIEDLGDDPEPPLPPRYR